MDEIEIVDYDPRRSELFDEEAKRLRAHPAEARSYGQLKRRLAAEHPTDREACTDARSVWIESVMRKAL